VQALVYILRGASGRCYIGSTQNFARRLAEHQSGSCHTTKRLGGEITCVASHGYASLTEARSMERRLKRMKNPQAAIAFLQAQSSPRL
jgi:predicted GIY-YIG superfamily endonuclease